MNQILYLKVQGLLWECGIIRKRPEDHRSEWSWWRSKQQLPITCFYCGRSWVVWGLPSWFAMIDRPWSWWSSVKYSRGVSSQEIFKLNFFRDSCCWNPCLQCSWNQEETQQTNPGRKSLHPGRKGTEGVPAVVWSIIIMSHLIIPGNTSSIVSWVG